MVDSSATSHGALHGALLTAKPRTKRQTGQEFLSVNGRLRR